MAGLVIRPRARLFHGHDWIYSSDILKAFGDPKDGDVVSLKDVRDRALGSAIYNSKSQIVGRRFCRQRQELDREFFERRIRYADAYRDRRGVAKTLRRVVWSESDGLPGVIVDRYESTFVLQTLTLAMDMRKGLIVEVLAELFPGCSVVERNDAPIRRAEGMELVTGMLLGESAPQNIEAMGVKFVIDALQGQKTGFYLDQMDSYREVAALAEGRKVLDCFSNQGAFALFCAKAGAASVNAVEISGEGAAAIRRNAESNGLTITVNEANAFDYLKAADERREKYDLVILDPPSFTKGKDKVNDAMRGYKEIHLRAFQMLEPDGLLATFSCSHHVSSELFREMIVDALVDAKRSARFLKPLTQSADHPVVAGLPETEYLKGYLVEMMPGR